MEVDEDIVADLEKAGDILDEKIELEQEGKRREVQELIDQFNVNHLHKEINEGKFPLELRFYFGGENKNFFLKCLALDLDEKNKNFIDIIASEVGGEIFLQDKLSTNLETDNIYDNNLNTNESIYRFLQQQQNRAKKKLSM